MFKEKFELYDRRIKLLLVTFSGKGARGMIIWY